MTTAANPPDIQRLMDELALSKTALLMYRASDQLVVDHWDQLLAVFDAHTRAHGESCDCGIADALEPVNRALAEHTETPG